MALQFLNNGVFSGNISATYNSSTISTPRVIIQADGTLDWGQVRDYGTLTWDYGYAKIVGQSGKGLLFEVNGGTDALTIDTSANATFAGNIVMANAKILYTDDIRASTGPMAVGPTGNSPLTLRSNGTTRLTIGSAGLATFSSTPIVLTRSAGDNTTYAASTAFVTTAVAAVPLGDYVTLATAQTITAAKTFTADVNVGAASTNGAGVHLMYSTTHPEIRIQAGENGTDAFTIYNTATNPDAVQFFINNNLGSSHLGNARGALKLESSSGVVLTLSGSDATFDGNVLVGSDSSLLLSNNATVSAYAGTNDSLYLNSKGSGIVRVNFAGGTGGFEVYAGGTNSIFDVSTAGNGTFAGDLTVSGGDIILGSTGRIQGVDTVSASTDAANKLYVDNAVAGVPQGDITAVVAGDYLTGGGTSGSVTLNGDNTKLAHIVDSANASVTAGWITVAEANTARRAGEIYVTDGESSDHSFIRIDWMRSYADTNFTVINCGGHQNRIQGVRVLQETADATYGKKYLQVKVTATSNYYVIITAPGTIPNYSDFTAVTPVLENTKTGYAVTGAQLEDLQNSSVGTHEGITVGEELYVNGAGNSYFLGNVGIGTTSPSQKLEVVGNIQATGTRSISSSFDADHYMRIESNSSGGILKGTDGGVITTLVRTYGDSYFNGGNVGIGTTNPGYKLEVESGTTPLHLNRTGGATSLIGLDINGTTRGLLGATTTAAFVSYSTAAAPLVTVANTGGVQFNTYGAGTLVTDASGNITVSSGGGAGGPFLPLSAGDSYPLTGNLVIEGNAKVLRLKRDANQSWIQYVGSNDDFIIRDETDGRSAFVAEGGGNVYFPGGNVGIGTTSPNQLLEVANSAGGATISISTDQQPGSQAAKKYMNLDFTGYNNNVMAKIQSWDESSSSGYGNLTFSTRDASNGLSQAMIIDRLGNVGIGTTNPTTSYSKALQIHASGNGSTLRLTDSVSGSGVGSGLELLQYGTDSYIINRESAPMYFLTSSTTQMTILANGNVGIGLTNPTSKLEVTKAASGPVVKFDNTSGTGGSGLEVNGGNGTSFALSVGSYTGNEKFRVQGNGNVGIGTSSPATQLEIFNNNDQPATLRLSTSSTDGSNVAAIISFENGSDIGGVQGRIENIIDSGEDGSTSFKFYTNNTSTPAMTLFNGGSTTIAGAATATNFILSSDKTLKNKIKNIKAKQVDVKWKNFELISEPGIKRSGVIAQELEAKHPEFIRTDKDGLKSVAYIDLLITKIAELEARIKKLEK